MKFATIFILIASCLPSTRAEEVLACTGSGFFITTDGYFVTNSHVVVGADAVKVKFDVGNLPAKVIKTDEVNDIAVLKLEGTFPCLPLGQDLRIRPGEDIFTIGFPMTNVMGETPKTTLGTVNALTGIKDDPRMFQVSVQIQPGSSGGPLVLKSTGNVIGVTSSSLNAAKFLREGHAIPQNVNYAMKSTYIRPLLATVPGLVEKLPKIHDRQRSWREVQRDVEKSVALVLVYKDGSNSSEMPTRPGNRPRPAQTQGVWVFPDSSTRILKQSELAPLDRATLWRARNEIFARNGYIFSTAKGRAYAASLGGSYRGVDSDQNRVYARMNKIEKINIERIKALE